MYTHSLNLNKRTASITISTVYANVDGLVEHLNANPRDYIAARIRFTDGSEKIIGFQHKNALNAFAAKHSERVAGVYAISRDAATWNAGMFTGLPFLNPTTGEIGATAELLPAL